MFKENEFMAELARKEMTVPDIAEALGLNKATIWRKIHNNGSFSRNEIATISRVLDLDSADIGKIFFAD